VAAGDFEQHLLDDKVIRRDIARHHRLAKAECRVDDDLGAIAGDRIKRHGDAGRRGIDHLLNRDRHENVGMTGQPLGAVRDGARVE
jgi:hypothetical protein